MSAISTSEIERGLVQLAIDRPDDRVNAINAALLEELSQVVDELASRTDLWGLVVTSGKPDQFVAGADLDELPRARSPSEAEAAIRGYQAVLNRLAGLRCTTVAAIGGAALGGGCELALACDYRVAADSPRVSVGQPEVQLGLLPAGGGCQRLPRLVGLAQGIELISSGRRLEAGRALRIGLVDEVVHPSVLLHAAVKRARLEKPMGGRQKAVGGRPDLASALDGRSSISGPRPTAFGLTPSASRLVRAALEATALGRRLIYWRARQRVERQTRGRYPAPLAALEAIAVGRERGLEAGLEAEARAFGRLACGRTARNLIWLFLAGRRQRHRDLVDLAAEPRPVERIGVVGAGFMGSGIAQLCAVSGLPVRLRDISADAVAGGVARVGALTRQAARRGRLSRREAEQAVRRVSATTDYSGFGRAEVVIEAVFEDVEVKRRVIDELEQVVGPETVIASNSSTLPIERLCASARSPERIVGMHFFSPVHRMPLLEVVRGKRSAAWAVATAVEVGHRLGKTAVVVNDGPGFYTSRVVGCMLNEAGLLLEEGYDLAEVDGAMMGFGFPVGPFALLDEIGLDVSAHAGRVLRDAFGERVAHARGVERLVDQGRLGRKSGRGFYVYGRGGKEPNREVYAVLRAASSRRLGSERELRAVQDRLALTFVNEAVRCLEEGILAAPVDGDLAAVLGLGFPPFLGGPFRYADQLGAASVRERLEALRQQHGDRFVPAPRLLEIATHSTSFYPDPG